MRFFICYKGIEVQVANADSGATKPSTNPQLSWFVYLLASAAVIGGFLFGYDTGVVSGAMLYVPDNGGMSPMSDFWKELIVSLTPGASWLSSSKIPILLSPRAACMSCASRYRCSRTLT